MIKKPVFVYSEKYTADLQGHVFPVKKYRLLRERLQAELGISTFTAPEPAGTDDLTLVHDQVYIHDLMRLRPTPATAESELPLSREIVDVFLLSTGGTILAGNRALDGFSVFHLGGGWHHAFPGHAEGFCYINDVAVAIRVLQRDRDLQRVTVFDCDLHQGNGTAAIFADDPSVFTFSLHQQNLYPAKQESDLDIGLPDFATDDQYLGEVEKGIARAIGAFRPDLVMYLAGADPFEHDQLGTLKVTFEGLRRRDELVFKACREYGLPVVVLLAGGYAVNTEDTVQIHFNTAAELIKYHQET